jgi:hypothetical protein
MWELTRDREGVLRISTGIYVFVCVCVCIIKRSCKGSVPLALKLQESAPCP